MTEDDFWAIVDKARKTAGDVEGTADEVAEILTEGSLERIAEFQDQLDHRMNEAFRWDLWGAAYVMNGGCSDDGFEYFRGWLIANGRKVFTAALKDPESLARLEEAEAENEDMLYSAQRAYEHLAPGKTMERRVARIAEPQGERWEEDDLAALFPKLTKKYG